ncbi:MAG TPA: ImmA/IrrE family metallo-endopeptidase [Bacillales bacterium]|nr:ImmA/IrrE family metallo-endopeptidase [Bacillales bacterium]
MNIENYQTTPLEDYIEQLYQHLGITSPEEINMHDIADRLGITIHIDHWESRAIEHPITKTKRIIINQELSVQERWQDFGHELCHLLRQSGNQLALPESFIQMQEAKANNFAYHFCIPTFMLLKLDVPYTKDEFIHLISRTFNVTLQFAKERFNRFERRLNENQFYKALSESYKEFTAAEEEKTKKKKRTHMIFYDNDPLVEMYQRNKIDVHIYGYYYMDYEERVQAVREIEEHIIKVYDEMKMELPYKNK